MASRNLKQSRRKIVLGYNYRFVQQRFALLIHHHCRRVRIRPNSVIRTRSIIHSKGTFRVASTSDVFGLEVDVCATGRKWRVVGGQAEEELRYTWFHKRRSALVHQCRQQCSWLTVPPITNDPSSKCIRGNIGIRRAVPLQSSRVDEEAVVDAARRFTCTSVDADGLPARVSGVGQCQVHAPVLLVSEAVPPNMDCGNLTKGTEFRGRTLGHSSGHQRWMCLSR
jgi:hypothetical protein